MSEMTTIENTHQEAPAQPLACHLRSKAVTGRHGPVANMGEVELENLGSTPLEIAYRMTVLQYLHLVVTDAGGKVVSEGHFGDRFAPTAEPQVLRLEPGAKFTAKVHLLATMPSSVVAAGKYLVQAVYEYDGFRAISDPVQVII
jgi:hypothetical protein